MLQLILPTILPSLISDFQISLYTAGLLVSSFALPYSLLQTPFGYLSDRIGRKKIMVLGLFLYSLATLLSGLTQNSLQLGMTQFLAGVGGASYHPTGISLLSFVVDRKKIGQAQGFHQSGGAIGSFIAPLLAAYIGAAFSWRYSFIFLSLFGLIITIIVIFGITDTEFNNKENNEKNAEISRFNSETIKLVIYLFCFGFVQVIAFRGLLAFLTTYTTEKYAIGLESASQLLAILQLVGIFGSPLFGRISDAMGRKTTLAILAISQALLMYSITYASMGILIILLGAMGLVAFGMLAVTDGWITSMNARAIMGTLLGVALTASFFSGAVVNPIIGFFADQYGFDFPFRILAIIPFFALPILKLIKDP
jgi:MFS family permease